MERLKKKKNSGQDKNLYNLTGVTFVHFLEK